MHRHHARRFHHGAPRDGPRRILPPVQEPVGRLPARRKPGLPRSRGRRPRALRVDPGASSHHRAPGSSRGRSRYTKTTTIMHLVSNFPLKCIVHYVNYNITVHDIYINVHAWI